MTWRHAEAKHGLVTVDTPRAQGLIGFVRRDPRPLTNLRAAADNDFCAILCTSLDDRPIADSSRLLLAATARLENSGMKWQADGRTLADWGQLPMAIEPVTGTITLAGLSPAKSVVARPLSAVGVPQDGRIPAQQANNDWSFPVGSPHVTTWYLIEVRR